MPAWLKELLTGDAESLPYRVAGTLLPLYAQPLTKIAALQSTAISRIASEMRIALGEEPIRCPSSSAACSNTVNATGPNLRTSRIGRQPTAIPQPPARQALVGARALRQGRNRIE
jgi:hypothetical protein